jgi:hypothetical protein
VEVATEDEARARAAELIRQRKWPCYFFDSDTSGEKPFEEFYSQSDVVNWERFSDIGVISAPIPDSAQQTRLEEFLKAIGDLRQSKHWSKADLVGRIKECCSELAHMDVDRFLDDKM